MLSWIHDRGRKRARIDELEGQLDTLRQGMFAPKNRGKLVEKTEEGIDVSMNLLNKGYVADDEIERFPGSDTSERDSSGHRVYAEYSM